MLELPPPAAPLINGHRRLRGPYTIGGALLRVLVPAALEHAPDLVAAHAVAIRAAAPDLRPLLPHREEPLGPGLHEDERILVPAPRRTLRVANGIAEFVRDRLDGPRALRVENVHEADATDRELLAVLMRRVPGLTVAAAAPTPPDSWSGEDVVLVTAPPAEGPVEDYVASDGTTDDPRAYAAYLALPPAERARAHDRRAGELSGEHLLGAVPYHRELGGDREAALSALWAAVDHCVGEGFLHAVTELGPRGLRLATPGSDLWWRFIHRTATALAGIGRRAEAFELYESARRASIDPAVHAAAAYGTAMLDARDPDPARRDLGRAMGWINEAIAVSTLLPDRRERAFKLGFDRNGRALIELRQGRTDEALRLVESAIELAERDLAPDAHPLHRMVLFANRAQLLARSGRPAEALTDFDRAIAIDPAFPDHYLDRGNLLLAMGRPDDALADYETAISLGPPLPEAYYNRAELRLSVGDLERALADLDHVLELDPAFLDAYVNRAGVLEMLDEHEAARRDVEAGLEIDPGNPHLHGVLGQLETAAGRYAEARTAFDTALARDPALAGAWANRAILRHRTGDLEGAVADLTRAIELGEDAALYANRAVALRDLGRVDEAAADLARARELDPGVDAGN
ncbi:tetratricopeptide repeat protein [Microtetraspora niveoalba]|uniref:tetratricopeptide repeat protein n=1 Tax=Microtetraspora niveoalba TaxID=46175 RepID=UPI000A6C2CE6|nr:tetratricopeptide repeat protein [Microtetraspora niveoalba]